MFSYSFNRICCWALHGYQEKKTASLCCSHLSYEQIRASGPQVLRTTTSQRKNSTFRKSCDITHYSPKKFENAFFILKTQLSPDILYFYYMTQAFRGPTTKINQSKCSIAGPIFSKYWTGHCPELSRTCVFAVFAFFSRVINLLLTKLARYRTGRISALGLFCTDLAAYDLYCQDLGPIFSQCGPRAWLIRYMYLTFWICI